MWICYCGRGNETHNIIAKTLVHPYGLGSTCLTHPALWTCPEPLHLGSLPLWRQCHLPRQPHQNYHRANLDSSFSLNSHAPWSRCPIKFYLSWPLKSVPPSLFPLHILGEGSYHNLHDNSKSSSGSPCLPMYSPLISQSESFQNITLSMSCSHLKPLISTLTPYHLWQLFPTCGANMKLF